MSEMPAKMVDDRFEIIWTAKGQMSDLHSMLVFGWEEFEIALSNLNRFNRVIMSASRYSYRKGVYGMVTWEKQENLVK